MIDKKIDYIWKYLRRLTLLSSEEIMEQIGVLLLISNEEKDSFLSKNKNYFEFEMIFEEAIEKLDEKILLSFFEFDLKIPTPNTLEETLLILDELERRYTKSEIFEKIYYRYTLERNKIATLTPEYISDLMTQLIDEKENKKIINYFCGTGNILFKLLLEKNNNFNLEGIEINESFLKILFFRILLKNYKNVSLLKGNCFENNNFIKISKEDTKTNIKDPDIIFAHPPFGCKVIYNEKMMRIETALFYKTIEDLNENGRAVLLIPLSYLKLRLKEVKELQKSLQKENLIKELIVLPPKSLIDTAIETVIVVLNKNKEDNEIKFWVLEKEVLNEIKEKKIKMSKKLLKLQGIGDLNDFLNNKTEKVEKNSLINNIRKLKEIEKKVLEANNYLDEKIFEDLNDIKNYNPKKIQKIMREKILNLEKLKKEMKKIEYQLKGEKEN